MLLCCCVRCAPSEFLSLSWRGELCTGAPYVSVRARGWMIFSVVIFTARKELRWVREVFIDITGRYQPPITPAIICRGRINAYRRHNASQVTTPERPSVHSPNIISHAHKNILCLYTTIDAAAAHFFFETNVRGAKNNTHPCAENGARHMHRIIFIKHTWGLQRRRRFFFKAPFRCSRWNKKKCIIHSSSSFAYFLSMR